MTNKTRSILALVSGATITAIGLVIVNVFFPEVIEPLLQPHEGIAIALVMTLGGGCYTKIKAKARGGFTVPGMAALLLFATFIIIYMTTPTARVVFGLSIIVASLLPIIVFRHRDEDAGDASPLPQSQCDSDHLSK